MFNSGQKIETTFRGRSHWFMVVRFTTVTELHAALYNDNIRSFPSNTVAYSDAYPAIVGGRANDECGRMYLLDTSINTLAHEAAHMANTVMARHGIRNLELAGDKAPQIEEEYCELVGYITSKLYSENTHY